MAGRRTSLASLAGAKVDAVPGRSDPLLLTLTLDKLVPTRFNPRRNFGTDEDLKAFGLILKKRQLQPAVVVSRAAYLKLWPDEVEHVGSRTYVIANGERRYRASLAAGLPTLDVVHNEDVANTRAEFLDAILSENNDREDLDPIERALGIETMVAELGGADKVAEHYGKSKGWVSQQRKLLKLMPELQALVSSGELPIRVGREIAGLPAAEQAAAWADETARRRKSKDQPRVRTKTQPEAAPAPSSPERFTAVNQKVAETAPAQVATQDAQGVRQQEGTSPASVPLAHQVRSESGSAEPVKAAPPAHASVPDPRAAAVSADEVKVSGSGAQAVEVVRRLPAVDWEELVELLIKELPKKDRHSMTTKLLRIMTSENSTERTF
ncbi:ParB/RepB/Spo0J family partition protein [Streptomyces sp. NPDC088178]|uniref:ParB/RepB/Spo0J family partition protein n=1 Tax=Streptomyces sp. NPDC088178 TaxID=3365836 RepID=UPI0038183DCF